MSEENAEPVFDTSLFVKVTATAKERLANIKASLRRANIAASEKNIIDYLICHADESQLRDGLPKKSISKSSRDRAR